MKVLVITVDRERTDIHRIDLEEGKYMSPLFTSGHFQNQADEIAQLIFKERPQKVIVEKMGVGHGLYDALKARLEYYGITLNEKGTLDWGNFY